MTNQSDSKERHTPLHDLLSSLVRHSVEPTEGGPPMTNPEEPSGGSTEEPEGGNIGSTSTLNKVAKHLEDNDWAFSIDRNKDIIVTSGTGTNGTYRMIIDVKEDDDIVIVYIYCPSKVPPLKRVKAAEYITRANYAVVIGNFEMDFSDGVVRYKGSVEFPGVELSDGMIKALIGKSAFTMDHYFPGLMRVIYGNMEAVDAIREIEPRQGGGEAAFEALAVQVLEEALRGNNGTSEDDGDTLPMASPVEASPVEASPVEASPVEASPVEASPVEASPEEQA